MPIGASRRNADMDAPHVRCRILRDPGSAIPQPAVFWRVRLTTDIPKGPLRGNVREGSGSPVPSRYLDTRP